MTDIYLLNVNNGNPPDIFMGHPLTGGRCLFYHLETREYSAGSQLEAENVLCFIKRENLRPMEIKDERKSALIEDAINLVDRKIEELKKDQVTSRGLTKEAMLLVSKSRESLN